MAKPKHHRCRVCNVVTSRYSHTNRQGPFTVQVWVRDPVNGEAKRVNGSKVYCAAHTPADGEDTSRG